MAMKLYCGTTMTDILNEMLAEAEGSGHLYVVVPDRFSLEAETALLSAYPTKATVNAEVTTLARLVEKLAGRAQKRLTTEGAVMAVSDIMARNRDALLCLKGDAYGTTAEQVYATIAQLAAGDVTPEDLDVVIDDPSLERKVHDLKLIYRAYRDFLAGGYVDASTGVLAALGAVPAAEWVRDARFYVIGYDALTRTNARLISLLDRYALKLTLGAVTADFAFGAPHIADLFPNAISVRIKSSFSTLREKIWLWADSPDVLPMYYRDYANHEDIALLEAADIRTGAERIARDIAQAVKNGARYRDFAVLCEDVAAVAEILQEYGIAVNADTTYSMRQDPLSRLVMDAAECAVSRFRTQALRRVALSPLIGIERGDFAVWDNYTLRFGVDFERHLSPYLLQSSDDAGERATAEKVRVRLLKAVLEYAEALNRTTNAEEFVGAVRKLMSRFRPRAAAVRADYSARLTDYSAQVDAKLEELLENIGYSATASGTAQTFLRMLEAGMKAGAIRVTPTLADAVNVFTVDSFGFRRYKRIFWLGADEGSLPTAQADCGLISDADIDRLKLIGAAVDPKISEVNERARFRVFSTMFMSDDLTVVTTGGQPNFFARFLRDKLLCPVEQASEDNSVLSETEDARHAAVRACVNTAVAERTVRRWISLACARADKVLTSAVSAVAATVGAATAETLVRPISDGHSLFFGSGKTSISQLERFFSCPFMHFAQYGLRCMERKEANVKAGDIGNFLHAVAEKYAPLSPATIEESDALAERIAQECLDADELLALDAVRLTAKRLKDESVLMCRTLFAYRESSAYKTAYTEVAFGSDLPPLEVGGVRLCGKIDRIDMSEDSAVILDYKTGNARYSYKDVYFGRQIQLFAYMRILTSMGKKPAAALFFPIINDYGKTTRCTGWVSSDPSTVVALDRNLSFETPNSRFLPVGLHAGAAKKGEWKLKGEEYALSEQEWKQWLDYTESLIGSAVKDMDAGLVESTPLALDAARANAVPCAYCAAASACKSCPRVRLHTETVKKSSLSEENENGEI